MTRFYIRTERQDTYVGSEGHPEVFESRREARARADELDDLTPSRYGRLIVSEYDRPHYDDPRFYPQGAH